MQIKNMLNKEIYLRKKVEICTCDICDKECDCAAIRYPVLFTTEGCPTKTYISYKDIDMCEDCLQKAINVTSREVQGYNKYEIIRK